MAPIDHVELLALILRVQRLKFRAVKHIPHVIGRALHPRRDLRGREALEQEAGDLLSIALHVQAVDPLDPAASWLHGLMFLSLESLGEF
jgi:hypothetical protein